MNDIPEPLPLKTAMIPVAGHPFDYLDIGSGEPVVFLHGALGDLRTFAPHCRLLSASNRAITYTQRYFGPGQAREQGPAFGIETHAADLIAFLDALAVGPVNLVAWSYAGHAALRAAQLRPDLLKAVLIYESGFQTFMTEADEIAAFKAAIEPMFGPIFAAAKAGDLESAVRHLIDGSAGEAGYFERQAEACRRIELDNAGMLPLLPSRRHHRIDGAGHFWPDEDPQGFVSLVRQWLSEQEEIG